jgi:protein-disulfide isomerase
VGPFLNPHKLKLSVLIILLCVLSVTLARAFRFEPARSFVFSSGNPKAPIHIVEYLDFQCKSCRLTHQYLEETFKKNPSKIYWQVRYFPLRGHLHSLKSAVYAECASRHGKFFEFQRLLLEEQDRWSALPKDAIDSTFEEYAQKMGISTDHLRTCVNDPRVKEIVVLEKQSARGFGVKETPTYFVNGKMAVGLQAITEEIEKLLEKTGEKK